MNKNFKDIKIDKNKTQSAKHDKFIYASYTRRVMSNVIDGVILLFITVAYIIISSYYKWMPDTGLEFFFIIIIYQSIFISALKATPGKFLFGIKVVNDECNKLSIMLSLLRAILAISFYMIFVLIFSLPFVYIISAAKNISFFFHPLGFLWQLVLIIDLFLMYCFFGYFNKNRTFYDKLSKSHALLTYNNKDN